MAALRQAGLVETTRGRGGGTVVTLKPRTPPARAAARISRGPTQPSGSTRWSSAASSSPAPPTCAASATTSTEADRERRSSTGRTSDGRVAGKRGAHRQADSRLHLTIASLTGSPRLSRR